MPRQTRAVLASLSSCAMAAFPALKPGRRSHYMISGLAQCSFALRPARSLTPFKGAFSIEGSGRLVASSPAPIATGWSEICRVGLSSLPLESCAFLTAHFNSLLGASPRESAIDDEVIVVTQVFSKLI